jgi:UPF0716 family protein affecting phage T7 exclusion
VATSDGFGLCAVQGLGILLVGAVTQAIGAPLTVALAGLTAATMLAMTWTHLRGRLIQAQQAEAKGEGAQSGSATSAAC